MSEDKFYNILQIVIISIISIFIFIFAFLFYGVVKAESYNSSIALCSSNSISQRNCVGLDSSLGTASSYVNTYITNVNISSQKKVYTIKLSYDMYVIQNPNQGDYISTPIINFYINNNLITNYIAKNTFMLYQRRTENGLNVRTFQTVIQYEGILNGQTLGINIVRPFNSVIAPFPDYTSVGWYCESNCHTGTMPYFHYLEYSIEYDNDSEKVIIDSANNIINNNNQNTQTIINNNNQNTQNITNSIDNVENTLLDDTLPNLDNIPTIEEDGRLSDLFLMPITILQMAYNRRNSCSPYNVPFLGSNITFPCINLQSIVGNDLYVIIDYLMCFGLIMGIVSLFIRTYNSFKELNDDLYLEYFAQHVDNGYKPRHGGA